MRDATHRVVLPVTAYLPKLRVVDVGCDDLLKAAFPVLASHQFHQFIVNVRASREKEAAARRELVEKEELLLETQFPMVSLCSLLLYS